MLSKKKVIVILLILLIATSLCEGRRRKKTAKKAIRTKNNRLASKIPKLKNQKQLPIYETRETNPPNFVRLVVMRLLYGLASQMGFEDRISGFIGAPPNADDGDIFGFGGGDEDGFSFGGGGGDYDDFGF